MDRIAALAILGCLVPMLGACSVDCARCRTACKSAPCAKAPTAAPGTGSTSKTAGSAGVAPSPTPPPPAPRPDAFVTAPPTRKPRVVTHKRRARRGRYSLAARLAPLVRRHRGDIAVAVRHIQSGESFDHNADVPMATASLIKVAVMIEAYKRAAAGRLRLHKLVTLRRKDLVGGAGILRQHLSVGARLSLRDLIRLMMAFSDNSATNIVIDRLGLAEINATMATLGAPNTRIHAKVMRRRTSIDRARSKKFGLGSTTCKEMTSLLERLHAGTIVSKRASAAMMRHLRAVTDVDTFRRYVNPRVRMAYKTGATSSSRSAAGVIFTKAGPVVACVLTDNNKDRDWWPDNSAERLIATVALEVTAHFSRPARAGAATKKGAR